MSKRFTCEEFLIAIKRMLDYIGPDKFNDILNGVNINNLDTKEKTPDDILEEINQYREK